MKVEFPCAFVDWGATHMRAYLCENESSGVVAKAGGRGISGLQVAPADELLGAIGDWAQRYGKIDLLLGGMVGSDVGWRTTPYLNCPLVPGELANGLVAFEQSGHRVSIVPGATCINAIGSPDFMRGEEVQILGWLKRSKDVGSAILCLPGTHTKWAHVRNGRLERFTTSLTGELYALLKKGSMLIQADARQTSTFSANEFLSGVDTADEQDGHLLHTLFSARSRTLAGIGGSEVAPSYLSGLLIGSDVKSAIRYSEKTDGAIELIGAPDLCELYSMALARSGQESNSSCGEEMVLEGFLDIVEATK